MLPAVPVLTVIHALQWKGLLDLPCVSYSLTSLVCLLQPGLTALYYASGKGNIQVVKFLLENGALVNKVQHCNVL